MMEMVRYTGASVIALVVTGILLAGVVNPALAVATMSDGYEYNDCILIGSIYEHNPVTMQNSPKAGVTVRLYGTDNTAGLHTNHLVTSDITNSLGSYKFTIRVGTMTDSTGTLLVRSAYPYYQIAFYNDAGSEYEIYDFGPLCGRVGETLGSSLKWVNIDPKVQFGWSEDAYLFPCTSDFYVHKKGQPLTVTAPAGTSMGGGQVGTDLLGNNYRTEILTRSNPKDCSDWCLIESQCRAATYVKPGVQGPEPRCWLKTSVPASSPNTNTVSFIKYDSSNPAPTKVLDKFENVDLKGSDLSMKNIPSNDPEDCAQLCLDDPKCYSATYVKPGTLRGENSGAVCFLKNAVPSLNANINTISWVKHSSNEPFGSSCWGPHLTPSFTTNTSEGKAPLTVTFTDTSIGASSRNWDLDGDGDYDKYDITTTYTYTSPGTYHVRLTVGGCPDNFESITKDIIVELVVDDQPVTNVGRFSITSNPSAANVYLDGNYMGATPYDSPLVDAGSHAVRLSMTGYLDSSQSVEVTRGNTAQLYVELLPVPATTVTGTLVLDSTPAGAAVSVDGTYKGTTPLTLQDIPVGSHALKFSLPGYETYSMQSKVTAGNVTSWMATLVSVGTVTTTPTTFDDVTTRPTDVIVPGFIGIGALAALAVVAIVRGRKNG